MNNQGQNPNLLNTGDKNRYRKKEGEIRTMESDISKLLKEEKPSVLELVTKRRGEEMFSTATGAKNPLISWKIISITTASLVVFLIIGFFAYKYFLGPETRSGGEIKIEK